MYPPDLPWIIYYRVGEAVLSSLPRRAIESISSSGDTNARIVRPQIPYGATEWALARGPWRPMEELPKDWLPYLNRNGHAVCDPGQQKPA